MGELSFEYKLSFTQSLSEIKLLPKSPLPELHLNATHFQIEVFNDDLRQTISAE